MPIFFLETKDNCYEASWEEIPTVEGIGKTPYEAIRELESALKQMLGNDDRLIDVGRYTVETCLREMETWRNTKE